jgi:hypothetical protein
MQLVIEFIIPEFIEGSTCFKRHTVHHQELETIYAASGFSHSALTTAGHHMDIQTQRLQIQFRAPDDERCATRNMLSLQ